MRSLPWIPLLTPAAGEGQTCQAPIPVWGNGGGGPGKLHLGPELGALVDVVLGLNLDLNGMKRFRAVRGERSLRA